MGVYAKIEKICVGCGKKFKVSPSRDQTARFHSKKCYQRNEHKRRGAIPEDLTKPGSPFGFLTVISSSGTTLKCQCKCGTIKEMRKSSVVSGLIKSCGCLRLANRRDGNESAWRQWLNYLKAASKHRSLTFDLSLADVQIICTRPCFYCGRPPGEWEGAKKGYLASCKYNKSEPDLVFAEAKVLRLNGIDRVDSSKGYNLANVVPACYQCNSAKMEHSASEFFTWIQTCFHHLVDRGLIKTSWTCPSLPQTTPNYAEKTSG